MKLPLLVYGLLFIALLAVYAFFQARKEKRPAPAWGEGRKAQAGQAMAELVTESLRVFALLAGGALLSIAFGKPGLWQQYAAWAVVALHAVKCWAIFAERTRTAFWLRLAVLGCLGYIWFYQLPLFDLVPP